MTNRWYAREYNDGDEQAILGLHETVFGAELSSEWWTWLYKQNPTGQGIIVVAEADRRIVGHYALIPLSMKVGDEICLGSLSLDTMIHPDWRNQGIFTKLAKKAYDLAAERGIHFVYGFPNRNSHHGFITRLGWTDLYKGIPLWVKPLRYENVLQTYTKGNKKAAKLLGKLSQGVVRLLYRSRSRIPQVSIKEVPSFDERFDALWSMTSLEYEIIVVRNITYLNWRYAEKPNGNYFIFTAERDGRLLGYMVLKCMELFGLQTGFLVDIMSLPEESQVSRDLIAAAVEFFESRQMDMVGCLMLPNTRYSSSLTEEGFIKVPKRMLPQEMYLGNRRCIPRYSEAFLIDPNNWFITWGDHDSV